MGTMLYSRGVFINRCFDELNLTAPGMISQIHREYAAVGAEILGTNTFGANRIRLAGFGLSDKTVAINQAGVRWPAKLPQRVIYVAGAMGPLGVHLEPLGAMASVEARDVFREHAQVLCEAGVDLLVLETFTDLSELREAVLAAREAAGDDMVIVAQVAIGDSGELPGGASALDFVRQAHDWPVDVLGFNCSVGPKTVLEALEEVAPHSLKPLSASPNAGLPARVEGRNIYLSSPEYMAQYSRRLLQAGARIIGGCCGTTPEHIKLMVSEIRSLQPRQTSTIGWVEPTDPKSTPLEVERRRCSVARQIQARSQTGGAPFRQLRRDTSTTRNRRLARDRRALLCVPNTVSTVSTSRMGLAPALASAHKRLAN